MDENLDAKPKRPRTARGARTQRAILEAAAVEFAERGFHAASITEITRRADVALGSFYTWFDSKEAIFRAVVRDKSGQLRDCLDDPCGEATDQIAVERAGIERILKFARSNNDTCRIIDEAQFVDPEIYRHHYTVRADRILERLQARALSGDLMEDVGEVHAWAILGMQVFLGMRFGMWDGDSPIDMIVDDAAAMLARGLARR